MKTLFPDDWRYWRTWILIGLGFLGAQYWIIRMAVAAALRDVR